MPRKSPGGKGRTTKSKKITKKQEKLWGLEPRTFNRATRQFVDQDYVNKLDDNEKKWLSDFNNTYYSNKYPRSDKPGPKTNLFDKAGVPRKEIFDTTNARNRDVHTVWYKINEAEARVGREEDDPDTKKTLFDLDRESYDNELIDYLDFKKAVAKYIAAGCDEEEARSKALGDMESD